MNSSLVRSWKVPSVLPGFGLALGITLSALTILVLAPLAALALKAAGAGWDIFAIATSPRTLAALRLSFGAAAIAAVVNAIFGLIIAWILVRYTFPGRRFLDALVDLPFALPTAVAGISLTALWAPNGWLGSIAAQYGLKVAYTPLGVSVAMIFVGLPFVVRAVQPILEDASRDIEDASRLLGATDLQTVLRVILPGVLPALITGTTLAFARAIGEYGSVIFIAGNVPMVSEIAPLLIVIRLEQFDYAGAAVVGMIMLLVSFGLLLAINGLQSLTRRRLGYV